jgi:dTDP-4-amino-4,6-dideoxygalactose transaminase
VAQSSGGELRVRLARPTIFDRAAVLRDIDKILASGELTNGQFVKRFEEAAAAYLGVKDVVAVSSCTAGLMILLRSITEARRAVTFALAPSFTWCATAHAPLWNGILIDYVDVHPTRWTPVAGGPPQRADLYIGVHTAGNPCETLGEPSKPTIFDAAHALGSRYSDGSMVGSKGVAEVFSLSPSKAMTTGEGGLISTNDHALARELRLLRNYGMDYARKDVETYGLNARMTEIQAAIGIHQLRHLDEIVEARNAIVRSYRTQLRGVPVEFQEIVGVSTYKDFTILVPDRGRVTKELFRQGIEFRFYYDPPCHRQTATLTDDPLPETDRVASSCVSLPVYYGMDDNAIAYVTEAVARGVGG